ncbi:adenylyl-sulfate kinase [Paenibacillus arenilitoris]|uniref:Adenylyl-sulfate kinase n=1 Tax=Paenibacillus arenilitoris TaxID=2772299 RepID=A0A927H4J8_9BACL|nr:adenylyl-sulfate kinase [Paenibacillus arenilitoris]MBD2867965.1 adenylyl-sulfate kinase [Paenibacillus arenilitoris]
MDSRELLYWQEGAVSRKDRNQLNQHKSFMIWMTGLSASGKSTIAIEVEKELHKRKIRSFILDGDNIRLGLNKNLTFSEEDRKENVRRVGEVGKLFVDAGVITISAFISPYQQDREMVRNMFNKEDFIEIYIKCSVEECEKRDPKGLYKKARIGAINDFTGISSVYEEPLNPEIIIDTEHYSKEQSVKMILDYLIKFMYR